MPTRDDATTGAARPWAGRRVVCIAAAPGDPAPGAMRDRVARAAPDVAVVLVTIGLPTPRADAGVLAEADIDDGPVSWGGRALALDPDRYARARLLAGMHAVLGRGAVAVLGVRPGAVALLGSPERVFQLAAGHPVAVLARIHGDDADPSALADLAMLGGVVDGVVIARPDGARILTRWQHALEASSVAPGDIVAALAAAEPGVAVLRDRRLVAGWFGGDAGAPLLDVDGHDPAAPWIVHGRLADRAHVHLSREPARRAAYDAAAAQVPAPPPPLAIADDLPVDAVMRSLYAEALALHRQHGDALPPCPVRDGSDAVVAWLLAAPRIGVGARGGLGRYWARMYDLRPDLQAAFPSPTGADHEAFIAWAQRAADVEGLPARLTPPVANASPHVPDRGAAPGGVNLVGYLGAELGLGVEARRVATLLATAGIPTSTVDFWETRSPRVTPPFPTDDEWRYDTTLAVIAAAQLPRVVDHLGPLQFGRRRVIGVWYWELETISEDMRRALDLVDEVWAPSRFVRDAVAAATDKPVSIVPLTAPSLAPSSRSRRDLGLPEDRPVVVCAFDFFSVVERKNPFAAIDAFMRAFAPGEGPVLVLKTQNGDCKPADLERLRIAAARHPDVIVRDEHLSRADHLALVRAADCLVSPHRSEGLGLHLLEALLLGVPVIATRYAAPIEFMTGRGAHLVPCTMIPVAHGGGAYPAGARWADVDVEALAVTLRWVLRDPAARVVDPPSLATPAEATRFLRERLLPPASTDLVAATAS